MPTKDFNEPESLYDDPAPGGLSAAQQVAAEAIGNGASYTDAAAAAGCARPTLFEWRKLPLFKDAVKAAEVRAAEDLEGRFTRLRVKAVDALEACLDRPGTIASLHAAREILSRARTPAETTQDVNFVIIGTDDNGKIVKVDEIPDARHIVGDDAPGHRPLHELEPAPVARIPDPLPAAPATVRSVNLSTGNFADPFDAAGNPKPHAVVERETLEMAERFATEHNLQLKAADGTWRTLAQLQSELATNRARIAERASFRPS